MVTYEMAVYPPNPNPRLPDLLRSLGLPLSIMLIDVGASGGILDEFRVFGDGLAAVGFDPLVAEINRLREAEANPNVFYEPSFIGYEGYDEVFPEVIRADTVKSKNNISFRRTSAYSVTEISNLNYAQTVYNQGESVVMAKDKYSIDT